MPKTWQPHQSKQFARDLELGRTYYYVNTHDTKHNPYEDRHTYGEIVFTDRLWPTNNPCTEGGQSAATFCLNFGPMHEAPPRNMRNLAGPAPQVAGPVPPGYSAKLDSAELLALQASVARGSDPHTRPGRGGKPKKRSRFF
ncbi:hypothetical protein ABZT06_08465 [Streptomyces sp. NPDC005483]|uniref:hypothetical protein n=1 Tax=Streptomyces sp. NPDC005483 TaxID=3154882 RepID=UPI0033AEA768